MPRMLDDRLPGIEAKRREIEGWPAMAKAHGWYERDDEVDAHLPYLNRDLGWDDKNWRATEHSFSLLLDRYVRPGMRVLEVGAAKAWAAQHLVPLGCEYVATDILADPVIGLGRGAFYEARVGAFGRVQADGEHLPFASEAFDVTYCVAALHHALDMTAMVREMARVTRKGGWVCALNEGTRALGAAADVPDQEEEKGHGINEHVHTLYAYLWAFSRSGLVVRRVEQAEGYEELARAEDRRPPAAAARRGAQRGDVLLPDLPRLLRRLALCPQGPSLDCCRERLRRPPPLPRALRQPLPPRSPRPLQGHDLRRRVVAREPDHAGGDLRARLLAALGGDVDRPLPAVPALRAQRVALRLLVAHRRRAVDARLRGADQEGALPAAARRLLGRGDAARAVRRAARRADRRRRDRHSGDAGHGAAVHSRRGRDRRARRAAWRWRSRRANVVFRDVEHLLAALLLPWFFLTPILYSLEELPGGLEDYDIVVDLLRWANPLTPPLYALRDPLFYGEVPAAGDVLYLAVAAVVSLGIGALVFRRVDDRIAVEL